MLWISHLPYFLNKCWLLDVLCSFEMFESHMSETTLCSRHWSNILKIANTNIRAAYSLSETVPIKNKAPKHLIYSDQPFVKSQALLITNSIPFVHPRRGRGRGGGEWWWRSGAVPSFRRGGARRRVSGAACQAGPNGPDSPVQHRISWRLSTQSHN